MAHVRRRRKGAASRKIKLYDFYRKRNDTYIQKCSLSLEALPGADTLAATLAVLLSRRGLRRCLC